MSSNGNNYPKWAAEAKLPVPCADCGFVPFEFYKIWDELWAKAELHPKQTCCLACLERRLGRPLGVDDFPPLLINRLAYAAAGKLAVVLEEEQREQALRREQRAAMRILLENETKPEKKD